MFIHLKPIGIGIRPQTKVSDSTLVNASVKHAHILVTEKMSKIQYAHDINEKYFIGKCMNNDTVYFALYFQSLKKKLLFPFLLLEV